MTLLLLLPRPPPLALLLVMRESSFSSSSEASPGTIMIIAGFKINQIKFREVQVVHRQTGKCIFLIFLSLLQLLPSLRQERGERKAGDSNGISRLSFLSSGTGKRKRDIS